MNKKSGAVLLAQQSRRISLRCPVIVDSAQLLYSNEEEKYFVNVELEYPMSGAAAQTIHSIILVVRISDRAGNPILSGEENELVAKQIRFGEDGFPCGENTTFRFAVDIHPEDGTRFGQPEVTVSRIHFEDGSTVDYLRGDFFPVPASPVPLSKKYDDAAIAKIREQLGETAAYVPEKLSPIVWRCVCGELCQEEECANCKAARSDIFGYFGNTEEVLHPEFDYRRLLKIALIVAGSVVGVLAITLTLILIIKNREPTVTQTNDGSNPPISQPSLPEGTLASERARYYLSAERFEDAWQIADKESEAASLKPEICQSAIEYYRGKSDYENACLFGERLAAYQGDGGSQELIALYTEAYESFVSAGKWDLACSYAQNKLNDNARLSSGVDGWIAALKSGRLTPSHASDLYNECLWVVNRYTPDNLTLKRSIVSEGVDALLANRQFAQAEALAENDPDGKTELLYNIRRSAVEYYLEQKDYLNAFETAKRTDDAELVGQVCEEIPDSAIRANLPAFISYLWGNPEKLRLVLANTLAQDRYAARLNEDKTVSYGANRLFDPFAAGYQNASAVSVAVGKSHTSVLLDNGRVVTLTQRGEIDRSAGLNDGTAIAISAAGDYTLVLLEDGRVKICGTSPFQGAQAMQIEQLRDVISVAAGEKHALFLRANGTVVAVGDGSKGQCATESWTDIVMIAAGAEHSVGLKSDGTVIGCGNSLNGRLDLAGWTGVIRICAGQSSTAAIRQDGSVLFAGGTVGAKPANPTGLAGITDLAAGEFGMIVRDSGGQVRSIGEYAPDLDGFPDGAVRG